MRHADIVAPVLAWTVPREMHRYNEKHHHYSGATSKDLGPRKRRPTMRLITNRSCILSQIEPMSIDCLLMLSHRRLS